MTLETFTRPNDMEKTQTLEKAVQKLNEILREVVLTGKPILFLLSGGSALNLLEKIDPQNLNSQITIAPLDERFSLDPKENNMAQIVETNFYREAQSRNVTAIDTRVKPGESQSDLSARFNSELNSWIVKNPEGIIIATIGIGPDGHTSGMMPFPEDPDKFEKLFDGEDTQLVVDYNARDKNPYPNRVTTTMKMMRKIDKAVVYVVGENKRPALERMNDPKLNLATVPARILNEMAGEIYLFTDITA